MLWPKDSTWCRKTSVALAAIQACYVNSDVTYSLGKKWTWNLWCSKERSGEEFVSKCGEDGNILETEAGVGVLMCTWLEALQTPSPRDYPNLVMTSIIRWAKSFGSNSYRVRELSQRWKPGHSKETYRAPSLIYLPSGLNEDSGLNVQGDNGAAGNWKTPLFMLSELAWVWNHFRGGGVL